MENELADLEARDGVVGGMRIIHLSCVAPPEIGGIGRVAAKEVDLLNAAGHDAHLVSLTTHAAFRCGNAGSIHALSHFVKDADIVHLHYPFFGTAGALARLRRHGVMKRLVMTLHMDATAKGLAGGVFALHRRFFQERILSSADVLLVSSKDYAAHASFAPFADKAIELPFGVDEGFFAPGPNTADQFGIPSGVPVVLFVGGMDTAHAFKGIDVLLRAAVNLPDAHLLFVGDGNRRASYEQLATSLGIAARCHFAGKVDQERLVNAYRSASVLVLPSISSAEAFGLVAIEAQACGVPVVASDLPGVRTVISSGQTGLLTPAGDVEGVSHAIRTVLAGKKKGEFASEKCREFVLKRFTWSKHMEGLLEVYHRLNGGRSS